MTGFLLPNARLTPQEHPGAATSALPPVTVLVPFYRETAAILRRSADMLRSLDYPHDRLSVCWLVDARYPEDVAAAENVAASARADFGGGLRVVPVPSMTPKAKALNHALRSVDDPFVALYDADTVPDPRQLRDRKSVV